MKVLIVGGGTVGSYVAKALIEKGHDIKIIEPDEKRQHILLQTIPEANIIIANGTEPKVLENAGIAETEVVVAVTGADETNLIVSTLSRMEYGVKRVVARVNHPKNAWLFQPVMGVDVALNQAELLVNLTLAEISLEGMLPIMSMDSGEHSMVEQVIGENAYVAGKSLSEISFPPECIITGVIREGKYLVPNGKTVLSNGDKVIAVIATAHMTELSEMLTGK